MRYLLRILVGVLLLSFLSVFAQAKIVFTAKREGDTAYHVYVMDDKGRNVHRLTHSEFFDSDPRWFPDGKRILFERDLTKGAGSEFNAEFYILFVKSVPEVHQVPHTHPMDTFPVVSPDGKRIAFNGFRAGEWDIYVMDLDGTNLRQLTNNKGIGAWSYRMDWSPSGNQIAYEHEGKDGENIWIMKADGTRKERFSPRKPHNFFLGGPSWSPSGTYIMYRETERKGNGDWSIVAARLIVQNVFTGHREEHDFGNKALIATQCWMGDDRTVLLSMKADLDAPTSNYEIYRYRLDSRSLTNLTKHPKGDYHPHWSPGFLGVFPLDKLAIQWGHIKQMD